MFQMKSMYNLLYPCGVRGINNPLLTLIDLCYWYIKIGNLEDENYIKYNQSTYNKSMVITNLNN